MQAEELRTLALEIQWHKTEKQNIELKAAARGCPTRLFDTLSSFSNQDQGGIIVFGIDESNDYKIVGVYDPQDLQKRLRSSASRWNRLSALCLRSVRLMGKSSYLQRFRVLILQSVPSTIKASGGSRALISVLASLTNL